MDDYHLAIYLKINFCDISLSFFLFLPENKLRRKKSVHPLTNLIRYIYEPLPVGGRRSCVNSKRISPGTWNSGVGVAFQQHAAVKDLSAVKVLFCWGQKAPNRGGFGSFVRGFMQPARLLIFYFLPHPEKYVLNFIAEFNSPLKKILQERKCRGGTIMFYLGD